jgi:hypothetical protein
MADVALIYDPRYHTFESWASLMVELYAAQNLSIPTHTTNWQDWAAGLKGIDVFSTEAIPSPYEYDDWKEWAESLVGIVSPLV